MSDIQKLNFYDTVAMKAFVLDILVENQQLKSAVESASMCADG